MTGFNIFHAAEGFFASLAELWGASSNFLLKTTDAVHNHSKLNDVGKKHLDGDNVFDYKLGAPRVGESLLEELLTTSSFFYLWDEVLIEEENMGEGKRLDNGPCSSKEEARVHPIVAVEGCVKDLEHFHFYAFDFGASLSEALIQTPTFAFLEGENPLNDEGGLSGGHRPYETAESAVSRANHLWCSRSGHLGFDKLLTRDRSTNEGCVRYFAWGRQPSDDALAVRDQVAPDGSLVELTSVEIEQDMMAVKAKHEHERKHECATEVAKLTTPPGEGRSRSKDLGGPRPLGVPAYGRARGARKVVGKRSRFAHFFEKLSVDTNVREAAGGLVFATDPSDPARDDENWRRELNTQAQASGVYESSFAKSTERSEQSYKPLTHDVFVSKQATASVTTLQALLDFSKAQESRTLARYTVGLVVGSEQQRFEEQKSFKDDGSDDGSYNARGFQVGVDNGVQSEFVGEERSFLTHADRKELAAVDASPDAQALVGSLLDENSLATPKSVNRIELLQNALLDGARLERVPSTRHYILVNGQIDASTSEIGGHDDTFTMVERMTLQAQQIPRAFEPGSCTPHPSGLQLTAGGWSTSSGVPEELLHPNEQERTLRARFVCYDAPWNLGDRRNWAEISVLPFKLTSPEESPATPIISEHGSDTNEGELDETVLYSPSVEKYRRGPCHDQNRRNNIHHFNTSITSLSHLSPLQALASNIMKDRQSRHERNSRTQEQKQHTSIFDLAKTAQARVRGMDDPFVVSKKQRQYVEVSAIHTYEPSSPSASSMEGDGYLSDMSDELKEDRCSTRQRNRNAALAALEGRTQPVTNPEPLMRTSRTEYADDVEAEHGQLHTFSPRPHRSATRVQREIQGWEHHLAMAHAEAAEEQLIGLGVTVPDSESRNAHNEALDWLNSDSPVDLRNGRPVFYYQPSPQADEFWAEMTIDQLNAQSGQ